MTANFGYGPNPQQVMDCDVIEGHGPVQPEECDADLLSSLARDKPESTRRTYAIFWDTWRSWAADRGIDPLPATPEDLIAFLTQLVEGGTNVASVKLARTVISFVHRASGIPSPAATAEVTQVIAGLERLGEPCRSQPSPLTRQVLFSIQATALIPRPLRRGRWESPHRARARGLVDIALVSLMRDGMLRSPEVAEVTWGQPGPEAGRQRHAVHTPGRFRSGGDPVPGAADCEGTGSDPPKASRTRGTGCSSCRGTR